MLFAPTALWGTDIPTPHVCTVSMFVYASPLFFSFHFTSLRRAKAAVYNAYYEGTEY